MLSDPFSTTAGGRAGSGGRGGFFCSWCDESSCGVLGSAVKRDPKHHRNVSILHPGS